MGGLGLTKKNSLDDEVSTWRKQNNNCDGEERERRSWLLFFYFILFALKRYHALMSLAQRRRGRVVVRKTALSPPPSPEQLGRLSCATAAAAPAAAAAGYSSATVRDFVFVGMRCDCCVCGLVQKGVQTPQPPTSHPHPNHVHVCLHVLHTAGTGEVLQWPACNMHASTSGVNKQTLTHSHKYTCAFLCLEHLEKKKKNSPAIISLFLPTTAACPFHLRRNIPT